MIKLIWMMSRHPHVTPLQFRDHYENHHASLVAKLLPMMRRYQRNYPDPTNGRFPAGLSEMPYGSITQVWLDDQKAFESYKAALSEPKVLKEIREDELHFIDHTKTMWFPVEEHNTTDEVPAGKVKVIALLARLPHITRDQYKAYYESNHAPLATRLINMPRRYQRNFPDVSQGCFPPGITDTPFDSVTQSWYNDQEDYERFMKVTREPAIVKQLRDDETHFLDTKKSMLCRVEECDSDLSSMRSRL